MGLSIQTTTKSTIEDRGEGMQNYRNLQEVSVVGTIGVYNEIIELEVTMIKPNPKQPRVSWDEDGIEALALDISHRGLLHPIIVVAKDGEEFTLVCGQRRLLATQKAGFSTIRAMVLSDSAEILETALVENLLRKDLEAFDQAEAFHVLLNEKMLCLKDIGSLVGKSVSSVCEIANLMRIPEELRRNKKLRRKPLRFLIRLSKYGRGDDISAAFQVYEQTGNLPAIREKSRDFVLRELSKKITDIRTQLAEINFLDLDIDNTVHNNLKEEVNELLAAIHGRGWFRIDLIRFKQH